VDVPQQPRPTDEAEFHFVWSLVQELSLAERHFNEMETRYRALASTWLLAAFAGIGFVASRSQLGIKLSHWLIIAIIGLAGTIGILLLWNLDLLVYHQLLDVNFEEARRLEDMYSWLPRTRSRMVQLMPGPGVLRRVVLFYMGGVDTLLGVSGLALALWIAPSVLAASVAVSIITLGVIAGLDRWMWVKTRSEVRVPSPASTTFQRLSRVFKIKRGI
jgi:hypothetical protein